MTICNGATGTNKLHIDTFTSYFVQLWFKICLINREDSFEIGYELAG